MGTLAKSAWSFVATILLASIGMCSVCSAAGGDAPAEKTRRIPPPGVEVPPADRTELQAGIEVLGKEIGTLRESLKSKPALLELLPDVEIFHNAARYALTYDEFFNAKEIPLAKALLKKGSDRAKLLGDGQAPWTHAAGLIVRGYVSKIDGSVQPYGLVVPPSFAADASRLRRLDIWYHGRGETLSEVNFLTERQKSPGEFTPADTFVLHPYGRYCNANRFAGEIDTFEAMEHVKKHYAIDEQRVLVRGFSMGGAACWQYATHHAGLWAAAAPGAGFSETVGFLHITDPNSIPWYERKLWHWYDCTDYAVNLFDCPTVAYSGENDGQKQAADMMAMALAEEGITLTHVIGPEAKHFYVPAARTEINRRLDAIAARGRDPLPTHVKFTTWTLRYNTMNWIVLDGLEHHWDRAGADGQILDANTIQLSTRNVTALTLSMPPGLCPLDVTRKPKVRIDGQELAGAPVESDRSWTAHFQRVAGTWSAIPAPDDSLRKKHGLQGPIDDAFMDSFVMVKPTGKAMNEKTGSWAAGEMAHAIEHWRRQFRGEARVKDDTAITDADIASSNLVLWGDPSSNAVLAKIADKLPIRWDAQAVHVGNKSYPSTDHVPVLIYPNPLNPKRYVVLNSGFTFREWAYENNDRQAAKLPDWAVVDVSTPPNAHTPGGIADAGFFGEKWELTAEGGK